MTVTLTTSHSPRHLARELGPGARGTHPKNARTGSSPPTSTPCSGHGGGRAWQCVPPWWTKK
eukprot:scaffold24260_cov126-Isochrysis_galbana.AAC.4